jgi:predicted dithiol-disulfide oxidoreductase (DUF899 family)
LLAREKAFTRERDALSAARRDLPMVKIDKRYVFDEPSGKSTLLDLFEAKRQLVVYHFMFHPSWEAGCKSCSYVADNFTGALVHLAARDTAFAAVSRAPLPKIEAFKERMGWTFRWLSSFESDFNFDFGVSFHPEEVAAKSTLYNYERQGFPQLEAPGISVFLREGSDVLHTYSTYGRGLDAVMNTYNFLDLTPLGRQEAGLPYPMAWIRHHDTYEPDPR